jgi:hypothetical protein
MSYVCKYSSSQELGQVISVAKWPSNQTLPANPMALKMLSEKCSYLPTKMRECAILEQPQLLPDVERNIF